MSLVLDAGAFLAVERRDGTVLAAIADEVDGGRRPLTHGGVVAQVWRGGSGRQAPLARLLAGVDVRPLDRGLGRRAGVLLRDSQTSDAVDAALVLLARSGDELLTSDPGDLVRLVQVSGLDVSVVPV